MLSPDKAISLLALVAAFKPQPSLAAPSSPPQVTIHTRHRVPPPYAPDTDGVWRRIPSYTLVGSTICDTCTAAPTATVMSEEDAAFSSSIPDGWVRPTVATPGRVKLTIALSVVLAVAIFFIILRFHFVRLRTPKQPRSDVEKRRHKKRSSSGETEKADGTAAARKWYSSMSRASARWRENTRYLARQRRGRRSYHLPSPSAAQTPTSPRSRQASVETLVPHRTISPTPTTSSSRSTNTLPSLSSRSDSSVAEVTSPPEPPAYPRPPSPVLPPRNPGKIPAHLLDSDSYLGSDAEVEDHPPYTPAPAPVPPPRAHLATDDKAILEELAARASAPPLSSLSAGRGAGVAGAPDEDDLEWAASLPEDSTTDLVVASDLPPPPPAAAARHSLWEKMELERAYAVREGEEADAAAVPSYAYAGQSTPLTAGLIPSAPPFEEEEVEAGPSTLSRPSAPPFEEEEEEEEFLEGPSTGLPPRRMWASAPSFEEEAEAGPSTPSRLASRPSAPPFEEEEFLEDPSTSSRRMWARAQPFEEEDAEAGPSTGLPMRVRARGPLPLEDEDEYGELEYAEDHDGLEEPEEQDDERDEDGREDDGRGGRRRGLDSDSHSSSASTKEGGTPGQRDREPRRGEAHDTGWG